MGLVFDVASPSAASSVQRADVACFVGYVARRAGAPLPAALRDRLDAAGWVRGIWRRPAAQIESLENLPVVLDGWDLFDQLFAWDQRPVAAGGGAVCATYLGAAMRSFFARGGSRAVLIRAGDPWPFVEDAGTRSAQRGVRIRRLVPGFAEAGFVSPLFQPHDPAAWVGLQHLTGLREPSLLVLPDLPDACRVEPPVPDPALPPTVVPEGFVECSEDDPPEADDSLRHRLAPRLNNDGFTAWRRAAGEVRAFLAAHQREVIWLGALPLPHPDAADTSGIAPIRAQTDLLTYLQRSGVLGEGAAPASAFVQLGWPWLQTSASIDLPESLEPPDGVLAGLIAAGAALRGTFRSVAGDLSMPRLRDVTGAEPVPAWGLGEDSPSALLARRLCVFAPAPDGWALQSDVTTSTDEAWRFGGASRLMGCIVRSARAAGDLAVFEVNGPAVWAQLRRGIEDMLTGFWREGAFAGSTVSEAFSVRCDRGTMTQADLDNGRLIVEISVRPAMSIERITVVLNLGNTALAGSLREAA